MSSVVANTEDEARQKLWLVDIKGLVHTGRHNLETSKQRYAQPVERIASTDRGGFSFSEVVKTIHPMILIGTSGRPELSAKISFEKWPGTSSVL